MILRRPLRILVFALPLLLILLVGLLGAGSLFRALGDVDVARALLIAGLVTGVLLFVDVVLLVGCLGLRAVMKDEFRQLKRHGKGTGARRNRQHRVPREDA